MNNKRIVLIVIPLFLAAILACSLSTPPSEADPNAFNTMVALTAQPQMAQTAANIPPTSIITVPPSELASAVPTLNGEVAIRQALLAKLGWTDAELQFTLTQNDGRIARGSLKRVNEDQGAAWFAGKDTTGKWVVAYIGQGVPDCADILPFDFPTDWISHCMDAAGQAIERSSAQVTPTEGTLPDVYAPNPLGPLFSSMYISAGMCYDLDVLFHTQDSSCDVYLDSSGLLNPRNGGLFSGYATLTPPSLNACKGAVLSADPIAPNTDLYMCFKTNLGKFGFFVARQMDGTGIEFDAYVFP